MSLLNLIKKLFGCSVEETRVIRTEVPALTDTNVAFAGFLRNMVDAGKIKNYKKLEAYINKHYHGEEFQWSYEFEPTSEMRSLAKQWIILGYKCDDVKLHNYVASIY